MGSDCLWCFFRALDMSVVTGLQLRGLRSHVAKGEDWIYHVPALVPGTLWLPSL